MSEKKSNKGFVEFFKNSPNIVSRVAGYITVLIGFVTSLITFRKVLEGNVALVTLIVLGLGLVVLWGSFFYIYFGAVKISQSPGFINKKSRTEPVYTQKVRYAAVIGIILLPSVAFLSYSNWRYYQDLPSNKLIILIADFDGPDTQKYRVTETIVEQLREAIKEYKDLEVKTLKESISAQQGSEIARARAMENKAAIAVWGWYAKTDERALVTIHFEIIKQAGYFVEDVEKKETLRTDAKALESFAFQEDLSHRMSHLIFLTLGLSRFELGDYRGAILRFNEALSQSEERNSMFHPETIFMYRGTSYIKLNREGKYFGYTEQRRNLNKDLIERAISDYSRAIEISPRNAMAFFDRALAYFEKGDVDGAIRDCDKALELKPGYLEAYFVRGNAFHEKTEYDKAISDFNQAILIEPKHSASYINRASVYSDVGNLDQALADYSKSLALSSDSAVAYYNRGRTYARKDESDNALKDFQRALQVARDPYIYQAAQEEIEKLKR